jgi:hypothetical protein
MRHPDSKRLSAFLDGDLPEEERVEMEEHLSGCQDCQALVRDLSTIRELARELPDQLPPSDLWPRISRAIRRGEDREPDVIRLFPVKSPAPAPRRRSFRLSPVHAAAAGLILALVSGAVGVRMGSGVSSQPGVATQEAEASWVSLVGTASPQLEGSAREVADLEAVLQGHRGELDPETVRILEKNLGVIDEAIREAVAALRADPGNQFLETHLERAIQAKGQYLRTAASLVAPVS